MTDRQSGARAAGSALARFLCALCFLATLTMAGAFFTTIATAGENTVRIGVLKYGTVNWELDAMKRNGLDKKHGIDVEIIPYAGEDATGIALQGGAVDIIVSDWLFVSRQRSEGGKLVFAPYSTSVGSIMVPKDSPIRTLRDLRGKGLGVAGGPLDKNWLLIQALAEREANIDLSSVSRIDYAAPPVLAETIRQGREDAVLIYWNYAARLEAEGFRTLISGEEAAGAAGATGPLSTIGYVFGEDWAAAHPDLANGFVAASRETKQLLKQSDEEWAKLEPLVKAGDPATLGIMRDRYRQGIPSRSVEDEEKDARVLYGVLAKMGGEKLVGASRTLDPGTYWSGLKNGS